MNSKCMSDWFESGRVPPSCAHDLGALVDYLDYCFSPLRDEYPAEQRAFLDTLDATFLKQATLRQSRGEDEIYRGVAPPSSPGRNVPDGFLDWVHDSFWRSWDGVLDRLHAAQLLEIALAAESTRMARRALDRLRDPAEIALVARKARHSGVRTRAIERAADPQIAVWAATHDDSPFVRRCAIQWIDDQSLLMELAMSDSDIDTRRKATAKLEDSALLLRIVLESPDLDQRLLALREVHDDRALERLAVQADDPKERRQALRRLVQLGSSRAVEVVRRAAGDDPDVLVRKAAVAYLDSMDIVRRIAHEDPSSLVRWAAATRLPEAERLRCLLHNATIAGPQHDGWHRMARAFTDQESLRAIATATALSGKTRYAAMLKLSDQTLLKHLLECDPDEYVRRRAKSLFDAREKLGGG